MLTDSSARPRPISVLVADDERAVVHVLEALICAEADLEFVGSAGDADEAIALAMARRPDVALVDVRMPGGGGLRAAREIARRCPGTRIVALTASEDEDTVIAMVAAGAHAYVPKADSTDRILREIHRLPDSRDAGSRHPSVRDARAGTNLWGDAGTSEVAPAARRRERRARIIEIVRGRAVRTALQPVFDLASGKIVGVEALPRIVRPPIRGADAWLAEAEAVGMVPALEASMIRSALDGLDDVPSRAFMSINVSPAAIDSDEVQDALADAPADRMVVEFTEHATVDDYVALNTAIAPLRARGFRVAIDDVGSSISSLRHVVMLSPDLVKLDVALTLGVDHDPTRHAVVAALADCAVQLGALSVAEGIASRAEIEHLIALGVRLGQGSLLAEPELLEPAVAAGPLNIGLRAADARKRNVTANELREHREGDR